MSLFCLYQCAIIFVTLVVLVELTDKDDLWITLTVYGKYKTRFLVKVQQRRYTHIFLTACVSVVIALVWIWRIKDEFE